MTPAKQLFNADGSFDWLTYFREQSQYLLESIDWLSAYVAKLTAENKQLRAEIQSLKKDNL